MAAASTTNDKQDVFSTAGAIVRTLPDAQQNQKAFEAVVELIKPGTMASSSDQPAAAMDSSTAASSGTQPKPKRKDKRGRRDRKDYYSTRRFDDRKAQCDAAGVPHTKHVKLAKATAQLTEQARKAARPEERGENKEDTKVAVREVFEDYFGKMPEKMAPAAKHARAKGQYVMQLAIMKFAEADML